jgi:hypothetical protein
VPRDSLLKYRRGTALEWATANPTLADGEPAFEIDTLKFKVGDGVTAWNSLRYVGYDGGNIDPTPTPTPEPQPQYFRLNPKNTEINY